MDPASKGYNIEELPLPLTISAELTRADASIDSPGLHVASHLKVGCPLTVDSAHPRDAGSATISLGRFMGFACAASSA